MAAYLLFIREGSVIDPEAMMKYQAVNREAGPSHGVEPQIVYGPVEALEGDAPEGVVLLRFPDAASARAWYDRPEYQAAVKLRQQAAPSYRAMLLEGWQP